MSSVMKKGFADLIFEDRNKTFGAYFLRRVYEKHIMGALILSISAFTVAVGAPFIYQKYFEKVEKEKKVQMVEVVLEDVPPIAPPEEVPPPPPPPKVKIAPPKVSKVKFLPPKVKPDEEVQVEEVPPTTEELEEANPGDVTQEGETLNELADVEVSKEQAVVEAKPEDNKIYTWVEESAQFTGGVENLKKFLVNNLKYPEQAEKEQISDFVVLSFVVNKDGSITDINVEKSAGFGMDEEAIRVIKSMPNWSPAKQNGSPARQKKSIKIPFVLK